MNKPGQPEAGERTDREAKQLLAQEHKASPQQGELTSSRSHQPTPAFSSILGEMLPQFPSSLQCKQPEPQGQRLSAPPLLQVESRGALGNTAQPCQEGDKERGALTPQQYVRVLKSINTPCKK